MTADCTGQIEETKTALLDQGLDDLTFHCSDLDDDECLGSWMF